MYNIFNININIKLIFISPTVMMWQSSSLRNRVFFSRATEGGLAPDAAAGAGAGTDGIVGGPRTPQQIASQKRLQATQAQVDEVVDIMKTNVEKVLERDQKLSELDDRAGETFMTMKTWRESKRIGSDCSLLIAKNLIHPPLIL